MTLLKNPAGHGAGGCLAGVGRARPRPHHQVRVPEPEGPPQAQGAQKFADLVAAKSGGKIQVKLFPRGTLGGDLQTVSALQGGTVEMTVLNAGILSAQTKEFGIYDFPFLFASPQEADAVTDGPSARSCSTSSRPRTWWAWPTGSWAFATSPTAKAHHQGQDLAGLKIRVIQSPIYIDMFNALGANAVPMPFPELYTALEQKAVDGQENPVTTILSSKFNEVQKHLAITRHMYNPQAVIVSKKFWDGLSPAEQKWINDAMARSHHVPARRLARAVGRGARPAQSQACRVTEFPAAELDKLRAKDETCD